MCMSGCTNKKEIGFLASVFVIFYFLAVRVNTESALVLMVLHYHYLVS